MARKLVARWVRQPTNYPFGGWGKLAVISQYDLKESLDMAIASLKHGQHPLETANAIDAVARTGGRPYAALFVPCA